MRPLDAEQSILSVWHAYIDESVDSDVFAIGGFLSPVERWVSFSQAWEQLLPFALRDGKGQFQFKMSEMAQTPERLERAIAFWRLIEQHVGLGMLCTLRPSDFQRARERLIVIQNNPVRRCRVKGFTSIYAFAFHHLLAMFQRNRAMEDLKALIPSDAPVHFFFDEQQGDKRGILAGWEAFARIHSFDGPYPAFVNDQQFLPIQAADLFCWWCRERSISDLDFGALGLPWEVKADLAFLHFYLEEDEIFQIMAHMLVTENGDKISVYDRKTLVAAGLRAGEPLLAEEEIDLVIGLDGV
jgi:hypothetical protein